MASKYPDEKPPEDEQPPDDEEVPKTKIFVGNIGNDVTSEELTNLFRPFGHVEECDAITYGRHGFVHMRTPREAKQAIAALHGTTFMGQVIKVEQSISTRHRWPHSPGRKLEMSDNPSTQFSQVEKSSVPQGNLSAQRNRNISIQPPTNSGNFGNYSMLPAQSSNSHANASNLVSRQSLGSQISIPRETKSPLQLSSMPLSRFAHFPDPNNPSPYRMPFNAPNVYQRPIPAPHQPNIGQSYAAILAAQPNVDIQRSAASSTRNVGIWSRTLSSVQPNVNIQPRTESSIYPNLNVQRRLPAAYLTRPTATIPQHSALSSFPTNVTGSQYLPADSTELNINVPHYHNLFPTRTNVPHQHYTADSNRLGAIQRDYIESSNQNESIFRQYCDTASNQPRPILQCHDSVSNQPTINKGFGVYEIHPTIDRPVRSSSSEAAPPYVSYRQNETRMQRGPGPVRGDHSIVDNFMRAEHAFRNMNINESMPQAQPRTTERVPNSSAEEGNQSPEDPDSCSLFFYGMKKKE